MERKTEKEEINTLIQKDEEVTKEKNYETFWEFYPFYLSQHMNKTNRILHFIGKIKIFMQRNIFSYCHILYIFIYFKYFWVFIVTNCWIWICLGRSLFF